MTESWVLAANAPDCDFPLASLPFGVFLEKPAKPSPRIGVAIGDRILDLAVVASAGKLDGLDRAIAAACREPALNAMMSLARPLRAQLRDRLTAMLTAGAREAAAIERLAGAFTPRHEAAMLLPARIGDYTDFYASIHHAARVGKMLRPANPLFPNYKWVPIAYHGRASSVVVSGTDVRRPLGQLPGDPPVFAASRALDYEVELAFFVGPGNAPGEPIPIESAEDHLFGFCLLNDWSARDIQRWEYQPLGPFLGKNFATSVSPWVVPIEALDPFRVPAARRATTDPAPLAYLDDAKARPAFDITLEVRIQSARMRERNIAPLRVSRANASDLYWTPAQMLAHHASNGCNLRAGDLLASGTVSGEAETARGCLLEIAGAGEPLELPTGETRVYLEDGDEVLIAGYAERPGLARIGFGECRGVVAPALTGRGC